MFIYSSEEIREVDLKAEKRGMPPFTLMEVAGKGLFDEIHKLLSKDDSILVLAGRGNNGGDASVLARHLKNHSYQVKLVFPLGGPKTETALQHLAYYKSCGYQVDDWKPDDEVNWIIDGLLGVGSHLPLREEVARLTAWVNQQNSRVISIDLPTGAASDTGEMDASTVKAEFTFSLHGYKPSHFLFPAADCYGTTKVIDIGLPHESRWKVWTKDDVKGTLPERKRTSHKGTFGTGLLIAGEDQMPGSAALAAIGALRFGIGKLSIATSQHASSVIGPLAPEATFLYDHSPGLDLKGFTAIAIGSGRFPGNKLNNQIEEVLAMDVPVILDAGALQERDFPKRKAPLILTPHPGEFRRMTGLETAEIQQNRLELARKYATEHRVTVVLKGTYTVIAFPDGTGLVNLTGNASLAKGGSGDTLTGMLLASLSTHEDDKSAVANAVFLHGMCADLWLEENGEAALTAHDFFRLLPKLLKRFSR